MCFIHHGLTSHPKVHADAGTTVTIIPTPAVLIIAGSLLVLHQAGEAGYADH